jgi:hypothetical protein
VNVGFVTPWMLGKGVIYIMLETKVQRELWLQLNKTNNWLISNVLLHRIQL